MMPPSPYLLIWAFGLVCALVLFRRTSPSKLHINPRFSTLLERQGLTTPEALLSLPAIIVSGHPDRNVARVRLGEGPDAPAAYLKREHRVRLKELLVNAFAGFGFVSKSQREAASLEDLRHSGLPCPDWIAVGQDDKGTAFLIVEECGQAVDFHRFLKEGSTSQKDRRLMAARVGKTLGRIHDSGFDQPDLYAKHILVDLRDQSLHLLDWQRTGRPHRVGWPERLRDLAALDATLSEEDATSRERLVCLRAYLQVIESGGAKCPDLEQVLTALRDHAQRLSKRRHLRPARHVSTATETQEVIWLDGEALCVTPAFLKESGNHVPKALRLSKCATRKQGRVDRGWISWGQRRQAWLVYRRANRFGSMLLARLCGKRLISSEVLQAGLIYRLQRHGLRTPRLLAFGQQQLSMGSYESFLLTEPIPGSMPFFDWCKDQFLPSAPWSQGELRLHLLREAGDFLRRLHKAGCQFKYPLSYGSEPIHVVPPTSSDMPPALILGDVDLVCVQHRGSAWLMRDLVALLRLVSPLIFTRTDELRLILAYLDQTKPTAMSRDLLRRIRRFNKKNEWKAGETRILSERSSSPSLPIERLEMRASA